MSGNPTLARMRPKVERTEYGQRVLLARSHAKMTQTALAKAVGMSQGTLAEAEKLAMGSVYTAQIAKVTGVNAEWLATGDGEMLGAPHPKQDLRVAEPLPTYAATTTVQAIRTLGHALLTMDHELRDQAATLLGSMARNPEGPWAEWLVDLVEKRENPEQRLKRQS